MTSQRIKLTDLDPDLQKTYGRIPRMRFDKAWVRWLMPKLSTLSYKSISDPAVTVSVVNISQGSLRVYEPVSKTSGAGLLWIHGGGMIMGSALMNEAECILYAKAMGLTVVSVDYRLAPKHPYPAAIDDCFEAWTWFINNADRLGISSSNIAIAGQSAGGGLTAALCQRIHDQGEGAPVSQILFYPMLDDRTACRGELTRMDHMIWNNHSNRYGWSAYLAREAGGPEPTPEWAVPARREDLSGLPPAWIGIGDKDLFLDESLQYAKALQSCGVECELIVARGAPHGFEGLVPNAKLSKTFIASAEAFLKRSLSID